MIVFIRICVFCSFLALNTTHIWAADLSCWSQVGFFTIYPDKYKIKKKKRRSCAGQHLSWCRTERLCSFPTGLELISSDSKGHHDQNKFKKNLQNSKFEPMTFSVLFICTQTKSWLQISCESFWLHSVPHQARALWVKKKEKKKKSTYV